jgi:glutathione S-transferase
VADYSLHCFLQSGNAYKVALMLTLCGADWRPVWVDFFNGETRTPKFRALNEMGEVPVLSDHREGDLVVTQSGVILYHLAGKFDKYKPNGDAEEREVLRWILWDNHKCTANIASYRFLSHFMKKEGPEIDFLKGRALSALKVLNGHLASHDWVASQRPTIADLSICGYLFWPDQIGLDWDDYPGIAAWLDRIRQLNHWAAPEALLPTAPVEA